MFVRIAAIVSLSAVALTGCGGGVSETDVDQNWNNLSTSEKQDLCNGYSLFGDEIVEVIFSGVNETEDAGLSEEELDLFMDKIREECS